MFSTHKMHIFGIYREKVNFLFIHTFYRLHAVSPTRKGGAKNAKAKTFSKLKYFWYQNICHVLTKKMHTHT